MSLHHKLNPTLKHLNPFIIQSMLIHSYGKTGTEAIYCSEDPEEEIAKALFSMQMPCIKKLSIFIHIPPKLRSREALSLAGRYHLPR